MFGEKERFRRTYVETRARPEDDVNSSRGKRILNWQRMWIQSAVCRLVAWNVSSLAAIVGSQACLLALNVGRKLLLFAGLGATVCGPLHIARQNRLTLVRGKGKKVLDLKRGEIRGELMQTEERKLPVLHGATLARQSCVF